MYKPLASKAVPFFGEEAQWNEQALVHKMHRCERYGACADELPGPAKIVHRTIFARASSPTIYNPTKKRPFGLSSVGAGNGARTRHLSLGKAALYQMSYSRNGASEWSRTTDTGIFSPLLYQLSYRGGFGDPEGARTPDLQRDRLAY